jgi:hypothetical protein
VTRRLKDLEQRTWQEYRSTTERLLKRAAKSPSPPLQVLGEALRASQAGEELRLQQWAHRTVFNTLSPEAEAQWRVIARRPHGAGDEDDQEEEGGEEGGHGGVSALLVQVVEAMEAKARREQREKDGRVEHALVCPD